MWFISEPVIGFVTSTLLFSLCRFAFYLNHLDVQFNQFGGNLEKYFIFFHIFGWITQFVGHGLCEERAPAIATNIFFLTIAPFFDVYEVMHMVIGYRHEEVLEYNKIIEADIAHYRLSKGMPMRPGIKINKLQ